jgi:hypothetical protein
VGVPKQQEMAAYKALETSKYKSDVMTEKACFTHLISF